MLGGMRMFNDHWEALLQGTNQRVYSAPQMIQFASRSKTLAIFQTCASHLSNYYWSRIGKGYILSKT